MRDPGEIQGLKAAADLCALFEADGSVLVREGSRHKTVCPFHDDRSPSLVIYDDGFKCFGCGAHGDVIEYLQKRRGLSFDDALKALGAAPQRAQPVRIDKRRKHQVIMPVPATAPQSRFHINAPGVGEPTAIWWYLSAAGERLLAVVRYPQINPDRSPLLDGDGRPKKTIRTWCWARRDDGSAGWVPTRPSDHLPLYGLDRLAQKPTAPVLIVEGEKSADAGHEFLPHHAVISWIGGAGNAEKPAKIDWSPLAGRDVILWPDYDKPGALAMLSITRFFAEAGAAAPKSLRVVDLARLAAKPAGWDIADGTREDAELVIELLDDQGHATLTRLLQSLPGTIDQKAALPEPSEPEPPRLTVLDARAAWLHQALPHLTALMLAAGAPPFPPPTLLPTLPKPSARTLGLCHGHAGMTSTIYIAWKIAEGYTALHVLLHELVHAALPAEAKHGKPFQALCVTLGYGNGGNATANPGSELEAKLRAIADQLPPWPADEPPAKPPKGPRPAGAGGNDGELADIANASRFLRDHRATIFHRPSPDARHRAWYIWDGRRWKRDESQQIMSLAQSTAKAISAEFLEQAEDLGRQAAELSANPEKIDQVKGLRARAAHWRAKAEQAQKLTTMENFVTLASSRPEINIDPALLDRHEYFLNCLNGTVDIRDGRLYPHDPKHLCTKLAPRDYVPDLKDQKLLDVVDHVVNHDPEVAIYAQDVLGRSIIGNNDLERFWVWQGPGRSGKGTLMEAIKSALGDYAMTAEFQSFIRTQGARVRDDLDRLHEARFVLASEVEKGEQMAAGVLKAMTGGDTIASRALFGTYREFKPRMTLHLQCNHRPRADDTDSGLWGRMILIPCGPEIPEDQRDPAFKRYLNDPATGGKAVLSWLLAGAIRCHSRKRLVEPASVKKATAEYRREQDPLREFFLNHLAFAAPETHAKTMCGVTQLLDVYAEYCVQEHLPTKYRLTANSIADRLEAKGCYRKKWRADDNKPYSAWFGVTLLTDTHLFRHESHRPQEQEHLAALGLPPAGAIPVPVFSGSSVLESPTRGRAGAGAGAHAHTRAGDITHITDFGEQKNTGTEKPTPPSPLRSLPAAPPAPAVDDQWIDLNDLGGDSP